jgi:hypothetical protein
MEENNTSSTYPRSFKVLSTIISYLFHPLFVGVMMAAYLIFLHPTYFQALDAKARMMKLLVVINNNVFFPLLVVALMRALGFNKSVLLKTQKERIVPYIASITFFFWTYYVFRNQPEVPRVMVNMCRGMFFATAVALVLNNYFKISMHGIAVGGMLGMILVVMILGELPSTFHLLAVALITMFVAFARKIVSDHQWFDIVAGIALGLATQLLALWF